ncbi:N-acetylmuramoyl-L-alanine amidase [candidate division KSB1 bacterium]|nr:N-acetylmuramoyl-L-alanine amidase [candidate division KSB1 bacterium]
MSVRYKMRFIPLMFCWLFIQCVGYQYPYEGRPQTFSPAAKWYPDTASDRRETAAMETNHGEWQPQDPAFEAALDDLVNSGNTPPSRSPGYFRQDTQNNNRAGGNAILNSVEIASRGDRSQFVIQLNRPADYSTNMLDAPDRFYIDFACTQLGTAPRTIPINNQNIIRIRCGQFKEQIARVVFDLRRKCKFDVHRGRQSSTVIVEMAPNHSNYESDQSDHIGVPNFTQQGEEEPRVTLAQQLGLKINTIIIDPGHGGRDPGAIGSSGLREKDVVLDIANRLSQLLTNSNFTVYLTREDDTYIPLEDRAGFANERQGDLFISIYANAHRSQQKAGIETFYLSLTEDNESRAVAALENSLTRRSFRQMSQLLANILSHSKVNESRDFAEKVQSELISNTGLINRGVKSAGFIVLAGAQMPAILAEVGFITNPAEERLLSSSRYRQGVAVSMFRAIEGYSRRPLPVMSYLNSDRR